MVTPNISALSRLTSTLRFTALGIVDPGLLEEYTQQLEGQVNSDGKFSQSDVQYKNNPIIPPIIYDYRCSQCLFWEDPNSCKVVEGEISEDGWCVFWVPPNNTVPLSYLARINLVPGVLSRTTKRIFGRV